MYASRVIVFFLASFILSVNAYPVHSHHRRASCRAHTSVHIPSPTNAAGSAPNAAVKATVTPKPSPQGDDDDDTTTKATKSSTATVAPSSNQSNPKGSLGGGSLLEALFPVREFSKSWSTSASANNARPLSDATLRPTREITSLSHDYVPAPDGKKSMKAHYPAGSVALSKEPRGGISFYALGPGEIDLTTAREATLGYSVYFEAGFEWNKGGKLPGLYGGNSLDAAADCGGGSRSDACFSTRLMWRGEGDGELYTYLPPGNPANDVQCHVAPHSDCNPTYGASVGRGSFKFAAGKWTTVSQRVRLNTPGKADGEMQLFANGKSVINVKGLVFRETGAGKFRGIMMQTFFGGHTADFASPKTQNAYFSDFSVAITESF